MFSGSIGLNSNIVKALCLLGPAFLFVAFAVALNWSPKFIEEQAFLGPSTYEIQRTVEQAISRLESDDDIDKAQLIKIFESHIKIQTGFDGFINALLKMINGLASAFLGVLLIYFASLLYVYQKYIKKKT